MSLLERNLAALAERWPRIASELDAKGPGADLQILQARSGAPTARYGAQLLHSQFDPQREAERLVASSCGPSVTSAVVLGFGLGYACQAALRVEPPLRVLAVEPDLALFAQALACRDLETLLRDPRLELHVGADPEPLLGMLAAETDGEPFPLANPCLLPLRAAQARHGAYFARVQHILVAARDRGRVNVDTLGRFGPLWVRNLLRNLEAFVGSAGVESLAGLFEGMPALVLASGPSLDAVMPRLRDLARRCVVISVDTSLRSCLAHGVQPDFVVLIDPQYWNSRHLDGTSSPRTLLIAESATHPRALRLAPPTTFFMSSLFPLGRFLESFGPPKGALGAGGSVATTAWDFARFAGAQPIVMAGLDLGYPGRGTHFRGAFFEHRFLAVAHRMEPAEHHAFSYLTGAGTFGVPSNNGNTVLTDRRMAIYASWFESQVRRFPGVSTVNLSAGGVAIPGIPLMRFEEVLAMPERRTEIDERVAQAARVAAAGTAAAWPQLEEAIARLLAQIESTRDLARTAIAAVGLARLPLSGPGALAEIDRCDRQILASGGRDILSFLMQPVIRAVVEGRQSSDPLERTREIYVALERSATLHERLMRGALERLSDRQAPGSQAEQPCPKASPESDRSL